ncbi:MAG TPA: ATP-binding protein [Candidatus Limnocylindrales bacterium]|nr:ATP-binding protein [Candidatus Limnocylindrales bacterium]
MRSRPLPGEVLRHVALAGAGLVLATLAVAALQNGLGVPNPSALYLVAVVAVAILGGTWSAVATAVAAFLLNDFLFVAPLRTFAVEQPGQVVNLVLLLFVGIVVGELAALQRARAEQAAAREREARALFRISRALATRSATAEALTEVAAILRREAVLERVWLTLGPEGAREGPAADTDPEGPLPSAAIRQVLQRTPGDTPARWIRVHIPTPGRERPGTMGWPGRALGTYEVRIEAGRERYGSLWASRRRQRGDPDRPQTRLLAAAADQIGQALRQDRLAAEAQAVEIARQSDALKSALLQSVSHDLRTPLATIRAAAGTLRPGTGLSVEDQRESAEAIEREVDYLARIVTNLLDLSRIEAGALRGETEVVELDDSLRAVLDRLRPRLGDRPLALALEAPPVRVDPLFLDAAVTNVVDNAIKHTPRGAALRIGAQVLDDGLVRLTIEDGGPGVPEAALPRLFDKFYRLPEASRGSRAGTGIGLAVSRGLVEAMGGRIEARRSQLGGLAIDIDLPSAPALVAAEGPGR